MNAEIICVGTELLLGNIVNTNATYLSQKLSQLGINVFYQSVVGDNADRLRASLQTALNRSDIILLTGGLGPTADDITKEIVSESLGIDLVENEASRRSLERFFSAQNGTPVQSNYKQCLAPRGAVVMPNTVGTAPGYCIEKDSKRIIMLPGPPKELKNMFENSVFPYLSSLSDSQLVSHFVRIFGVGESKAEELLGDLVKSENPTVATYAGDGEVMIRITAKGSDYQVCEVLCKGIIDKIKEIFGENIYAIDSEGLEKTVVDVLKSKGLSVATAESCTGGMLAQRITAVPGSSSVFKSGFITYTNEVKHNELDVPREILDEFGAISEQTAAHMAINVSKKEGANLGIGITGVAGPDKSEGKDVGLVFVALADKNNVWVRRLNLTVGYDRDKIRNYATLTALDLIRRYVYFLPDIMPGANIHGEDISVLESQPTKNSKPSFIKRKPAVSLKEPVMSDEMLIDLMTSTFIEEKHDKKTKIMFDDVDLLDPIQSLSDYDEITQEEEKVPFSFKAKMKSFGAYILNALPNKKSSIKDNILKSLFIISLAGLIISATYLLNYFITGNQQKALLDDTRELWYSTQETENDTPFGFDPLLKVNKDTKAWIKINNTSIDNPVVQTSDNDYYLNYNFNSSQSRYGTLFFDYRDVISESGNSKNLVIYGHNMKDGSMFAGLLNYKNLNFYKQNPTFELTTLYEKSEYQVFSVFLINSKAHHDNGYIYNFLRNSFTSDDEFINWIDESKKRSLINTAIDISSDDEILTLVTCAYDFDDARLVVMARKTRDNETAMVNTAAAAYNPSPMYPQIWYDNKGIKNPYAEDSQTSASSDNATDAMQSEISSASDTSEDTSVVLQSSSIVQKSSSSDSPASTDSASSENQDSALTQTQ